MKNFKLYWLFYKSTIAINFSISCIFLLINIELFPVSLFTIGHLASFGFKEVFRPGEYYLYYNIGLTKMQLFFVALLLNIFFASLIICLCLTYLKLIA